jgi:hypothetical protein
MTQPSLESFFAGGGGKSISWKDKPIGTTISGTIRAVHPPQQQTDPATGEKQFKKNGEPKLSVRVDLDTSERDPEDPEDDGSRGLYVQGWMQGAIGDAIRQAGHSGPPEVGAQLSVTLTAREANSNPALNPINKFTAIYVRPTATATQRFFNQSPGIGEPTTPTGPQRPESINEAAWAAMPPETQKQVAATFASMSSGQPPF